MGQNNSRQSESFARRHWLLLTVVYVALYGWARVEGQIEHQFVPVSNGLQEARLDVVAPPWSLVRWKRQAYRAAFAPLMVAEEEGRNWSRNFMERRAEPAPPAPVADNAGYPAGYENPYPSSPAPTPGEVDPGSAYYDFDRIAATLPPPLASSAAPLPASAAPDNGTTPVPSSTIPTIPATPVSDSPSPVTDSPSPKGAYSPAAGVPAVVFK